MTALPGQLRDLSIEGRVGLTIKLSHHWCDN